MKLVKKEHMLMVIIALFLLLTGGVCISLYLVTGYPLYFIISTTGLILGGTYMLFFLLRMSTENIFWKIGRVLFVVAYGLLLLFGSYAIIKYLQQMETVVYPAVSNMVVFLILFAGAQVFYKLCDYVRGNTTFEQAMIRNSKSFMRLIVLESLLSAVSTLIEAKQLLTVQKYLGWFFTVLLFYYVGCILLSMVVNAIRKVFIN